MDGIAVILNPANGVTNLTKQQIKDIYTGAVNDWSQVGGTAGKIVVISRDTSSGTYEAFGASALGGAKVRGDALLQASNQAVATTVANTPASIGYIGLGYLNDKVKAVTVNSIECKKETVLNKTYPLSRPLFMYTNGKPAGAAKMFLDFILSMDGQKIVEDSGFVALPVGK
jgi:phosphate transport system substrate-binding protein